MVELTFCIAQREGHSEKNEQRIVAGQAKVIHRRASSSLSNHKVHQPSRDGESWL